MSESTGFATPMVDDDTPHTPHTGTPVVPAYVTPTVPDRGDGGPPKMDPSRLKADADGSFWGRLRRWSRAVDEAAGFDTTQGGSGTRPPPRSEYPTASVIGDALGKTAGIVGDVTSGLSWGQSDRLDKLTGNPNQEAQEKFRLNHPNLSTTAQVVGSIPTSLGAEGALMKVIPRIPAPAGIVQKGLQVGGDALRGSIVGAGQGAGMSPDDPGGGALTGAAFGFGIPAATGILGMVGKPLVTGPATRLFPGLAEQEAAARIAQAFQRDQISGPEAQAALKALGLPGALMDAGGANVTGLAETVANQPGPGKQVIKEFLEGRMESAPVRINQAINIATGSDANFHGTIDALQTARSTAAGPKYDASFSRIVPTAQEAARVAPYIADPIGQEALQKGLRRIEVESIGVKPFDPADYGVTRGPDGKFVLGEGVPNLRLMDAVKRGYDEVMDGQAIRNEFGKLTGWGQAVDGARRRYVGTLREMYPRYAGALDAWGGPSQSLQAMQLGRDALKEDAEVTAAEIAKLSDNDKDFFRIGLARELKDRAFGTADGADATRKIFGNKLLRDKILAGFDNPGAFQTFQEVMQNEAKFATTRNEVIKGPSTARRIAGMQDMDYATPATMALTGHPVPAAANIVAQTMRANPAASTDPVKGAIARQLVANQPDPYFSALQRAQERAMSAYVRSPAATTGVGVATQPSEEERRRRAGILYQ